ncbi:MAG: tripartite tricarboxylate transporter TctB family protein [Desulfitobacterium hafniense]|nr:tripartite tricarboxylate transporter TctB family protein [Desulfitobacterium hafniense]
MSKKLENNVVALVLLVIFIGFLYLSFNYSAKARLVPVPIAIASIILIIIQLLIQNFAKNFDLSVDPSQLFKATQNEAAVTNQEARKNVQVKKQGGGKETTGIGLVLLFLAMILLIGMMPAIFLFVLGYFIILGQEKWLKALIYTAICEASIYFLFVTILNVHMYEGLILKMFLG